MEIYHQYVKKRYEFGRWPAFTDEGAEMIADIRPNDEHAKAVIDKNPVTTITQVVPEMSEHEVNTTAVIYASKAANHVEGGWPKDVDYTEAEHTIRYRKKVEKDEEYIATVTALGNVVIDAIKKNNAIDIYEEYFTELEIDHSAEVPEAKVLAIFRDPSSNKRSTNSISWQIDGAKKIATAYSILDFQQQPANMSLSSYIWDISNPNEPEFEMRPQSQLVCNKFNLKDPNVVGAGQYNGQFVYFDMRKGNQAVEATPIEQSHRDPVYDFAWLQSKTGTECMTCSTDGMVLWWDIRKLGESLESMPLKEKGSETLLGGVALEYDPAAGATKFMVGTESGTILSCNRKAKNPQDRVGASYGGHHCPIYTVKRHPTFPKYFLSVADWTARIWTEDLRTPLMSSKYHGQYLTGGAWSPTRPGVFFTLKMNGTLDCWDLVHKHTDPTLTLQINDKALAALAVTDSGKHLGVGSKDGSCSLLELCAGLYEPSNLLIEKQGITALFERETSREKNLEKALKEARIKARKEAAKKDEAQEGVSQEVVDKIEAEFYKMIEAQS